MHIAEIEIMFEWSFEFLKLEYTYVFDFWPTDPFLSLAFHFHESSTINEVGKICRLYSIFYKSFNVDNMDIPSLLIIQNLGTYQNALDMEIMWPVDCW